MKRIYDSARGALVPGWFIIGIIAISVLSRCAEKSHLNESKPKPELKP